MPTNVVKTPRDEHLWGRAKEQAAKQGRSGDWAYVMGIYQRMKKSLVKATHPIFRTSAHPGQIPGREYKRVTGPPRKFHPRMLLEHTEVPTTPREVVRNLGLSAGDESAWARFLEDAFQTSDNAVTLRKRLHEKFQQDTVDPALRQVIWQRANRYYTSTLEKSMAIIVTPDELLEPKQETIRHRFKIVPKDDLAKATARGGKYYRRAPTEKGGYRYFYDEKSYNASRHAHSSGDENTDKYIEGQIRKCVEKAGSCDVSAFKGLAKKYGADRVGMVLKKCVGGKSIKFEKGKFSACKAEE